MIRKILGFAVMAVVALLVLKIALGLLGVLIGLAVSVLVFAARHVPRRRKARRKHAEGAVNREGVRGGGRSG